MNETFIFSHVDVARNILYVTKPFDAAGTFNVTICIGYSITTQIIFNVFEEINIENINCLEER